MYLWCVVVVCRGCVLLLCVVAVRCLLLLAFCYVMLVAWCVVCGLLLLELFAAVSCFVLCLVFHECCTLFVVLCCVGCLGFAVSLCRLLFEIRCLLFVWC